MRRSILGILALSLAGHLAAGLAHAALSGSPLNLALDSYKKAILINTQLITTIKDARLRREIGQSFAADGKAAMAAGRHEEAKKAFLMAGNFINEPSLFRELGNCYMYLGEYARAIVLYKKALKVDRSDAKTMANLGLAFHHTQRDARAAEAFCRALNLDPRIEKVIVDPTLRENVVRALVASAEGYAAKNLHVEAIGRLRQALGLSEDPSLRIRLGEAYEAAGRRDDAIEAFKTAVIAKGELLERIGAEPLQEGLSVALYNEGVDCHKKKDYARAEKVFRLSLQLRHRAKTLYNLGNVAVCQGDLTAAIEHYGEAIRLDEKMMPAYLNLALVYGDQGMQDKAIDVLKKLIILAPSSAQAYDLLAKAYEGKNEPEKAAQAYVAAVEFDASLATKLESQKARALAAGLLHDRALDAARAKDFASAVGDLEKAVALRPTFDAFYLMGNALVSLDRLDGAIAAYERAASINGQHAELYNNLGNVHLKLRHVDRARASFQKAVTIRPDYVQALNNLGIALRKEGKLQQAIQSYKKALEVDPNYAAAHFNLGNAYSEMATKAL